MGEEHPQLQVEGLDLPLDPYEYKERWEDKALVITAHVRIPATAADELRRLWRQNRTDGTYLSVVRLGRDEEPREMRFGKPRWSQHEDYEKHEVVLVDRALDQGRLMAWPYGPEAQQETGLVIQTAEQMDALLDLLAKRGKLSQQDVDSVRAVPRERLFERLLDLHRVDDLDDWE